METNKRAFQLQQAPKRRQNLKAMNRSFKEFAQSNHQQRRRLTTDEDSHPLDLFSRNRPRVSLDSSDRAASLRLGKISVGSVRSVKSGLDDLLTSTDSGKHDYDWLLTPPETPLFTSAEGNEVQQSFTTPRRSSAARSVSTSKPSRLSSTRVAGVESNVPTRPARSSSVTRSSVSYSQSNNSSYYSSIRSSTSLLNTSSASVSSYIRPSSPITRSSSTARPSTPSTCTTPSRSSTPSRVRSAPTITDKPRSSYGSRPSSPRPNNNNSRPSTPIRRSPIASSPSPGPNNNIPSLSVRSLSDNGRSQNSGSRPSSPNPSRVRSQQPDFSHDTPPNLRTTMPDRPVSAGRSRPVSNGTATEANKANSDSQGQHGNFTRRHSSPIVTRGRSVEPKGRNHVLHSNGYSSEAQEPRRSSYVSESPSRRSVRVLPTVTSADSNACGRTFSKKSLDMAMKHMDIREGSGSTRPLGGTVRYPQSVRSASSKIHASPPLSNSGSGGLNGRLSSNGYLQRSGSGKYNEKGAIENGRRREENGRSLIERLSEVDMFESSRYDAILLKEDLKNTNWLLSADEKSDQSLIFDTGFEHLPEPYL